MNNVNLILGVLGLLLGLPASADAPAAVPTHAYVYVDSGPAPKSAGILLDQGSAVDLQSCAFPDGTGVPRSAAAIAALLAGNTCLDDMEVSVQPGQKEFLKAFHQAGSGDRIVFESSQTYWSTQGPAYVGSMAMTAILDRRSPDQFNAVWTFVFTTEGSNPALSTEHSSTLRAYDTMIQYPALPPNVIEQ